MASGRSFKLETNSIFPLDFELLLEYEETKSSMNKKRKGRIEIVKEMKTTVAAVQPVISKSDFLDTYVTFIERLD